MRFGYVSPEGIIENLNFNVDWDPPSGVLLDDNGSLSLLSNESIITQSENIVELMTRWGVYGNEIFSGAGGKGSIILTNQRIVAIRIPRPWDEAHAGSTAYSSQGSIYAKCMELKMRKAYGMRQFYEIPLSEIVKIEMNSNRVLLLSNYYCWRTYLSKSVIDEIVVLLRNKEFARVLKGFGRWKYYHINYIDPKRMNEKQYDTREVLLRKAIKCEDKGKPDEALILYKKIINIFPDDRFSQTKVEILSGHTSYNLSFS